MNKIYNYWKRNYQQSEASTQPSTSLNTVIVDNSTSTIGSGGSTTSIGSVDNTN